LKGHFAAGKKGKKGEENKMKEQKGWEKTSRRNKCLFMALAAAAAVAAFH